MTLLIGFASFVTHADEIMLEDFEDGEAEYFQVRVGGWSIVDGRYRAIPNGDALATVRISDPLPSDLSLQAVVNGEPGQGELYSNAFVSFDYQNENEFKFAATLNNKTVT